MPLLKSKTLARLTSKISSACSSLDSPLLLQQLAPFANRAHHARAFVRSAVQQ